MFTGLVRGIGSVVACEPRAGGRRLRIATGGLATAGWRLGDSVAVAGACLTVAELDDGVFAADLSAETLALTTLGALGPGAPVNLEPALAAGERLGGHFVTGHVDGVGRVVAVAADGDTARVTCEAPAALARFIAVKGAVTVDGVSLTVNRVDGRCFEVMLVPHTRSASTLGGLAPGAAVNLEADLLARYLARLREHDEHD